MKIWKGLRKHVTEYRVFVVGCIIIFGFLFYKIVNIDINVTQTPKTAYDTRADCTHAAVQHDREVKRLLDKMLLLQAHLTVAEEQLEVWGNIGMDGFVEDD